NKVSGGVDGIGASVVNALNKHLEVCVHRVGQIYYLVCKRATAQGEIEIIGETNNTVTTAQLAPDPHIFTEERTFNFEMLEQRIRELAFLNKGLTMTIEDKRDDSEPISYYYEGGIRSYVKYINQTKGVLHEPFYIEGEDQGIEVEI